MTKKLCKDCKWYRKSWIEHIVFRTNRYDMCASPNTCKDLITGNERRFCDTLRRKSYEMLDYSCGPEGKFWEAK
jgi:hypothetical protein